MDFSGIFSGTGNILMLVLALCCIAMFIGLVIWMALRSKLFGNFPVTALVFDLRSDAITPGLPFIDACRRKNHEGKEVYEFKRRDKLFKPPSYKHILPGNVMILFSPTPDEYHACKVSLDRTGAEYTDATGEIKTIPLLELKPIMDESMKFVHASVITKAAMRFHKKGLMEKFGPIVMFIFCAMLLIVMLYAISGNVVDAINAAQPIANALLETSQNLALVNGVNLPVGTAP